jgi:hypothetical protein
MTRALERISVLDKKVVQAAIDSINDMPSLRRHVRKLWESVETCAFNHCGVLAIIDSFLIQVDKLSEEQAKAIVVRLTEISQQVCTDEQIIATREEFVRFGYNPMAWLDHIKPEHLEGWKEFIEEDAS